METDKTIQRKSRWSDHPTLYWLASCLLCALLGAGFMQGRANLQVIAAQNAACHWTIQHELQRQEKALLGQ